MEKWLEDKCEITERSAKKQNSRLQLFKTANEICGTFCLKLNMIDGKVIEDSGQNKMRWKEHFVELYTNVQNPVDKSILHELRSNNDTEQIKDFILEEAEKEIKNLKTNKAPGNNNITAEMVHIAGQTSVGIMHKLCNKVYNKKIVSSRLRKGSYCACI